MTLNNTCDAVPDIWDQFLQYIRKRCSSAAYGNWFAPIKVVESTPEEITLEIPNIFVKEYLLSNYKEELLSFLPVNAKGEPAINFIISRPAKNSSSKVSEQKVKETKENTQSLLKLNHNYRFDSFISGPSNEFAKSAAVGVAVRPGKTYNPLFIHGPVGLGKTHILHSIGHYIQEHNKKLSVQCITTEALINEFVDHLKNKSVGTFKRSYRCKYDVLLVDDIQYLQNRPNLEEEFCNTFETLINQNKQIVITSDKPPSQLKLSERMIARMEWGLVAHIGIPELETRVAILQHKAQQKGLELPNEVAFFIAEHIYNNVRQLEGAINRLSAHCRLLNMKITEELVTKTLREMLQHAPSRKISVDSILTCVASVFDVRVSELKGNSRMTNIVLPRQVAMYLACKLINCTLHSLRDSFGGKTHSTILHACRVIPKKAAQDEKLRRQIHMIERNINT